MKLVGDADIVKVSIELDEEVLFGPFPLFLRKDMDEGLAEEMERISARLASYFAAMLNAGILWGLIMMSFDNHIQEALDESMAYLKQAIEGADPLEIIFRVLSELPDDSEDHLDIFRDFLDSLN